MNDTIGITAIDWNTHMAFKELENERKDISIDVIKKHLNTGLDLDSRNDKNYTLSEQAGFKQRYDIVDLLSRSSYITNLGD